MAGSAQSVKCTILTLRSENVMVPNAAIAEIISARDAAHVDNTPDWYVGKMPWRDVDVPLVSFEAAAGSEAKGINLNTQVAVLYAVSQGAKYPYLGLVISGVPHVSTFSKDQIITDPESLLDAENHPMVAQKTRINGAAVSILDIDAIELMVIEAEGGS
jgi:chemosensory pili system protein ChpC